MGVLDIVKVLELLGYVSEDFGFNFGLVVYFLVVVVFIMEYGIKK